jgi:hypothetical protein
MRPATLSMTLPGFNDRTAVQQAASSAVAKVSAAKLADANAVASAK